MSLLDTSSGAAASMRTLLGALVGRGWRAVALQAQVFDSAQGGEAVAGAARQSGLDDQAVLRTAIAGVEHVMVRTRSRERLEMTAGEEDLFMRRLRDELRHRRPDMVVLWGGLLLEAAIMREARTLGIPVVFYLVSPGYHDRSIFRDVSAIVTDTQATADLYKARLGLDCKPIGKFVDPASCVARERHPEYITFINPSLEKGANVFLPLAKLAAREAPGIRFMVVQSRGRWEDALKALGFTQGEFPNVTVAAHQKDMRPVYGVTKALLVPSVWHESGSRVIVEAHLNGIPVLASRTGGSAELVGAGGVVLDLPDAVRAEHARPAPDSGVRPWLDEIRRIWSEPSYYGELVAKARAQALQQDIERNLDRFLAAVQPGIDLGRVLRAPAALHSASA